MEEARDEEIEKQEIPEEDDIEMEEIEADEDKEKGATEETPTVTLRPSSEWTLEVVSYYCCCFWCYTVNVLTQSFELTTYKFYFSKRGPDIVTYRPREHNFPTSL